MNIHEQMRVDGLLLLQKFSPNLKPNGSREIPRLFFAVGAAFELFLLFETFIAAKTPAICQDKSSSFDTVSSLAKNALDSAEFRVMNQTAQHLMNCGWKTDTGIPPSQHRDRRVVRIHKFHVHLS
jgi:hypothetical protein